MSRQKFILRRTVTKKQILHIIADNWDDAKRILKNESAKFVDKDTEISDETMEYTGDTNE